MTKIISVLVELPADSLGRAPFTDVGLLACCLVLGSLLVWSMSKLTKV